ncbi:MAG TPA: hypothetical protein VLC98_16770 [Phnomibacter sp.]|nr:hypothetical protein [Phnomibacter sp.]
MYQLTKKKTPLWAKIAVFLVLCSLFSELLRMIYRQPTLNEELIQLTQEINAKCPLIIDSTTRLDNTTVLAENKLLYNYTILQPAEASVKADTAAFQHLVKESQINKIQTNPRFSTLKKEKDLGFIANWYDEQGKYICGLIITPEDYLK